MYSKEFCTQIPNYMKEYIDNEDKNTKDYENKL